MPFPVSPHFISTRPLHLAPRASSLSSFFLPVLSQRPTYLRHLPCRPFSSSILLRLIAAQNGFVLIQQHPHDKCGKNHGHRPGFVGADSQCFEYFFHKTKTTAVPRVPTNQHFTIPQIGVVFMFSRLESWVNVLRLSVDTPDPKLCPNIASIKQRTSPPAIDRPTEEP